jgi:hypothetical protein
LSVLNLPKIARLIQCPGTVRHADLSYMIAALQREAPWHAPIFQAVLAGEITLCMPLPGQSLPIKLLDQIKHPVIVLINDDGPLWLGPDGWACAERAMRWARAAMLHGSAGEARHYRLALEGAFQRRRVVIADTSSELLPQWEHLVARLISDRRQILCVRPTPGCVHPVHAGDD